MKGDAEKLSDMEKIKDVTKLKEIAKEVRKDILLEIYSAQSGHPGGALSCTDILVAIYFALMQEGDKVILSKGHASAALYAVLAEKGFFPKEELKTFRALGSRLQGHPSLHKSSSGCGCDSSGGCGENEARVDGLSGIDSTSGSLGQGLSIANGLALGFQMNAKENDVYCILGDGEIQEGQVWEAAMSAAHYKLNHLIAFLDYNKLQIDGQNAEVMGIAPVKEKFESFGFFVQEIDGHNFEEIIAAVESAKVRGRELGKPCMIIANTVKGKGVSFMENQVGWHGKAPNKEEFEQAVREIEGNT